LIHLARIESGRFWFEPPCSRRLLNGGRTFLSADLGPTRLQPSTLAKESRIAFSCSGVIVPFPARESIPRYEIAWRPPSEKGQRSQSGRQGSPAEGVVQKNCHSERCGAKNLQFPGAELMCTHEGTAD
jgi:hypothetical protein